MYIYLSCFYVHKMVSVLNMIPFYRLIYFLYIIFVLCHSLENTQKKKTIKRPVLMVFSLIIFFFLLSLSLSLFLSFAYYFLLFLIGLFGSIKSFNWGCGFESPRNNFEKKTCVLLSLSFILSFSLYLFLFHQ